jgi:hypothetical protein
MPDLQIGQTSIYYTVRYSSRTKRQRLVVTPEAVEVVAPTDTHKSKSPPSSTPNAAGY